MEWVACKPSRGGSLPYFPFCCPLLGSLQVSFRPINTFYKWFVGKPRPSHQGATSSPRQGSPGKVHYSAESSPSLWQTGMVPGATHSPRSHRSHREPKSAAASSSGSSKSGGSTPKSGGSTPSTAPAHDAARSPKDLAEFEEGVSREEEIVEVLINGQVVPTLRMDLDEKGSAVFVLTGSGTPAPEAVASMPLNLGPNKIEFIYRSVWGSTEVGRIHSPEAHGRLGEHGRARD